MRRAIETSLAASVRYDPLDSELVRIRYAEDMRATSDWCGENICLARDNRPHEGDWKDRVLCHASAVARETARSGTTGRRNQFLLRTSRLPDVAM